MPNTARYLVRGGREIVVDPSPGGSERNLRLFLLGSALGILCHQRGLLPLHANAIVVEGGAVAFAGHSGAGKSTLAAHFQRSGYEVLCDDVCMISFDEAGRPFAWPGLPRLKLWGDAAAAFGHDSSSLDQAIEGLDKYHVPMAGAGTPGRFRSVVFTSCPARKERRRVRSFVSRGRTPWKRLWPILIEAPIWARWGSRSATSASAPLSSSHAEIYTASRVWGYDVSEREAARLERHVSWK